MALTVSLYTLPCVDGHGVNANEWVFSYEPGYIEVSDIGAGKAKSSSMGGDFIGLGSWGRQGNIVLQYDSGYVSTEWELGKLGAECDPKLVCGVGGEGNIEGAVGGVCVKVLRVCVSPGPFPLGGLVVGWFIGDHVLGLD